MTLAVPLAVRLKSANAERFITRDLRDLRFRSTAPGGFASAEFSLDRPLTLQPAELDYYSTFTIYDTRHGGVIWEGRLEDPGRGASPSGSIWRIRAVGNAAHAQDNRDPRVYCDRRMIADVLRRSGYTNGRTFRVDYTDLEADTEIPAIDLTYPEGASITSVAPASTIDVMYRLLYDCGQQLGRVRVTVVNGSTTGNRDNRITTRQGPGGSGSTAVTASWSTTPASLICSRGGGNAITAGHDVANIRVILTAGGAVTAGPTAWAEFSEFLVRSLLKDVNGSDITSGYSNNYVLAHEVVTDMIGRGDLYMLDPATAVIETGTAQIDQLAFTLGCSPFDVYTALMTFEQTFYWAFWEKQTNGKIRSVWRAWPTTVRYEVDVGDGIDSPGSADGLHNEALVAYTDWAGRDRTTKTTSTVARLTNAGLTRTLPLDITGEENSAANAQRAGDQALAEHASPPNAGTLTVARPVRDLINLRWVMPWEIRPGELIRVRGILPNINSLNASARDGVTVFKVVESEYDSGRADAQLALDSPPVTLARQVAALHRRTPKRR